MENGQWLLREEKSVFLREEPSDRLNSFNESAQNTRDREMLRGEGVEMM